MNAPRKQLDADRLFQVAEAVMTALAEIPHDRNQPITYERDFIGTLDDPRPCWGFTLEEVKEAQGFLIRMGYLTTSRK